jgi:hypothetical protein
MKNTMLVAACTLALLFGGALALHSSPTHPSLAAHQTGAAEQGQLMAGLHLVPVRTVIVHLTDATTESVTYDVLENSDGQCLDANSNDYPNNGDGLQLWTCANDDEQLWSEGSNGNLVNFSGKCMDANSKDYPNNGDGIQLWSCANNDEQDWTFLPQEGATGWYQYYNTADTGKCLDANSHDYGNNGDAMQLWSCGSTAEQAWY